MSDIAPNPIAVPTPDAAADTRIGLVYRLGRIQLPQLGIPEPSFREHLQRAFHTYHAKQPSGVSWTEFLNSLYAMDWIVCCGCLNGLNRAWEILFNSRTGRSDCLLIDALRARACRLYPGNEERQDAVVSEFWSHLIVSDNGTLPIMQRYDGQRPLTPWLIRVFQNFHLSKLRRHSHESALPDDDIAMALPIHQSTNTRWHEAFCEVAANWLEQLPEPELLLLGLRWRYKLTQRQIADLYGVHEGTTSRQLNKLREGALEQIGKQLLAQGWTGDDLSGYILTEMAGVLIDSPSMSADRLAQLVKRHGLKLP